MYSKRKFDKVYISGLICVYTLSISVCVSVCVYISVSSCFEKSDCVD